MAKKAKRHDRPHRAAIRPDVYETCKKGDVRMMPPVTATEDGWKYIKAQDGDVTHETFRPARAFDRVWDIRDA